MNKQYTSTKTLNAEKTFALLRVGMNVEYSDIAEDCFDGNFGTIVELKREQRFKAFTNEPFYRYLVNIDFGPRTKIIEATCVLGYAQAEIAAYTAND